MKKVIIKPGICNLDTVVTAESEDQMEVKITIDSKCQNVCKMFEQLGDTFDAFEVCLAKLGEGPFYEYAQEHFPGHASCPTINGIIKCIEAECRLALPQDASIVFVKENE